MRSVNMSLRNERKTLMKERWRCSCFKPASAWKSRDWMIIQTLVTKRARKYLWTYRTTLCVTMIQCYTFSGTRARITTTMEGMRTAWTSITSTISLCWFKIVFQFHLHWVYVCRHSAKLKIYLNSDHSWWKQSMEQFQTCLKKSKVLTLTQL